MQIFLQLCKPKTSCLKNLNRVGKQIKYIVMKKLSLNEMESVSGGKSSGCGV